MPPIPGLAGDPSPQGRVTSGTGPVRLSGPAVLLLPVQEVAMALSVLIPVEEGGHVLQDP